MCLNRNLVDKTHRKAFPRVWSSPLIRYVACCPSSLPCYHFFFNVFRFSCFFLWFFFYFVTENTFWTAWASGPSSNSQGTWIISGLAGQTPDMFKLQIPVKFREIRVQKYSCYVLHVNMYCVKIKMLITTEFLQAVRENYVRRRCCIFKIILHITKQIEILKKPFSPK